MEVLPPVLELFPKANRPYSFNSDTCEVNGSTIV
jgi:hypothetical protein